MMAVMMMSSTQLEMTPLTKDMARTKQNQTIIHQNCLVFDHGAKRIKVTQNVEKNKLVYKYTSSAKENGTVSYELGAKL